MVPSEGHQVKALSKLLQCGLLELAVCLGEYLSHDTGINYLSKYYPTKQPLNNDNIDIADELLKSISDSIYHCVNLLSSTEYELLTKESLNIRGKEYETISYYFLAQKPAIGIKVAINYISGMR
ncbi:unnamed protein product [Didymodactylos carnosus]|uniref:Uncharacterized protein n=1 Tax=Didymodactylos carnosus TaxID=1234261 RepID=A0A8S2ET42_9BILA|nr:unnamed protein product [Didymodactylos carnosus]CAF4039425.1 unnamed protein product [Didymodactylos carnosus]